MTAVGQDTLNTRCTLNVDGKHYAYYSLAKAAGQLGDISRLPFSMKVLLENLLRFEDGVTVTRDDLQAMADWQKERRIAREIQYRPARVLMQDFTGVPAVVDLDRAPVLVAQQVLQQHLHREGQLGDVGELLGQLRQAEIVVRLATDREGAAALERVLAGKLCGGHGFLPEKECQAV